MKKYHKLHITILTYLFVILKYPIEIDQQQELKQRWIDVCKENYEFCPNCFPKSDCCTKMLTEVHIKRSIGSDLNKMFGSRSIEYGTYKKNIEIVIKHLVDKDNLIKLKNSICILENDCKDIWQNPNNTNSLKDSLKYNMLESNKHTEAIKICPITSVDRFLDVFALENSNEIYLWTMLNLNVEGIVLTTLGKHKFPVPMIYSTCGFTIIQSYSGLSLYEFYDEPFTRRIDIAKRILEAAIQFTEGVNGFRLYLTDATPDNIVVDKITNKISIVDLDNIIIVDSYNITSKQIQKHEKIPCHGCFAYIPDELCSHQKSDINIFAVCQLFYEDLYGNKERGFLHSIPDKVLVGFPNLLTKLTECIYCNTTNCDHRLSTANELIFLFNLILNTKETI